MLLADWTIAFDATTVEQEVSYEGEKSQWKMVLADWTIKNGEQIKSDLEKKLDNPKKNPKSKIQIIYLEKKLDNPKKIQKKNKLKI